MESMYCCAYVQQCSGIAVLITLDPRDRRPLYLQIMDDVRRAIVMGTLRGEDPLPSVRELAAELVVNPRTVSQAYQELEREGVVYMRRGYGTFVSPAVQRNGEERRNLARAVAERALLEARRNGLAVHELVLMIQELAAEEGEAK
jgi:GntR family transcriptional regulator